MFSRSPEARATSRAAKAAQRTEREEKRAAKQAEKDATAAWRESHPLEKAVNQAGLLHLWPHLKSGRSNAMTEAESHPVAGSEAELFDAGAHKGWTASRIAGNSAAVLSAGALLPLASGRKNKGAASINILWGDGHAETFTVKPADLAAANRYVHCFNAYSAQLAREQDDSAQQSGPPERGTAGD